MSTPLVSILVPTYNGERFLKKTLRSALEQSYKEIEIVVGDDASTDSTPAILAAIASTDPRVRVIRHASNVGAFDNPKLLLEAARGEFVKFLLHDDLLMPDCVRDLVRGLQSADGAAMAFSRRGVVGEDGRPVPGIDIPVLQDRAGPMDGRQLGDRILENCANVVGELTTVLFRRADADLTSLWHVDGHRLAVLGDAALWLALLARGPAFYTPRTLSSFRLHGTQRSHDPRLRARGSRDWPLLIDWARRRGFLAEPAQQRTAYAVALRTAAHTFAALPPTPDTAATLEAVHLSTVALAELVGGLPSDLDQPLPERGRDPAVLAGMAGALVAPEPD